MQKDLAALIVAILVHFSPSSASASPGGGGHGSDVDDDAARDVLLSLPGMSPGVVDRHLESIRGPAGAERSRRAEVLALLEGVRGRSIHELGRVDGASGAVGRGKARSAMQTQFMVVDGGEGVGAVVRGGTPEEGSLVDLFG